MRKVPLVRLCDEWERELQMSRMGQDLTLGTGFLCGRCAIGVIKGGERDDDGV